MIHNLKPYSEYKDSGVPWLGEVPEHWGQLPGRACFTEKKIPNTGLQEKTVLSLSYGQIIVKPPEKLHGLVPASFETYQIIEPNDIIIRSTDLQNDWNSLRFGFAKTRGIITSAYMCFQTTELLIPEYGHLLLHTYDLMKIFYGLGSGLRQNLDWRDFKYLPCPVPPLSEQSAIVHYLDYIDLRIRRYIRAKQKLIKLLEEQKQAIINQAVIRGLDPNVKLKPSGVEWLGNVPAHWDVMVAKRVCDVFIPQRDKPELNDIEGIPWVTLESIGNTFVEKTKFFVREEDAKISGSRILPSDSIVASCIGRFGITSITTEPVIINQQIQAYIPRGNISPMFFRYCVQISKPYFEMQGNSTTLAYVDREAFSNMPFLRPPISEQHAIVEALNIKLGRLDQAITEFHREISLLREYRTRLIADIVTGKLDVREAAESLPKEIEEMEASEDSLVEDNGLENNEIETEQTGDFEEEVLA